MKTTCYAAGCGAALVGEAQNVAVLADEHKAEGWIYFFDAGCGLAIRCLCPAHSPPVKEAVRLLVATFGERFSHMHLGWVAKLVKETPIIVPTVEEVARG